MATSVVGYMSVTQLTRLYLRTFIDCKLLFSSVLFTLKIQTVSQFTV